MLTRRKQPVRPKAELPVRPMHWKPVTVGAQQMQPIEVRAVRHRVLANPQEPVKSRSRARLRLAGPEVLRSDPLAQVFAWPIR